MSKRIIKIAMLSTGEEVLHGDITDTNAAWLSRVFFAAGLPLYRRVTVGDNVDEIAAEITRCSQICDLVIVNGGLGPTSDDNSAKAMAKAMQVELELNQSWLVHMQQFFAKAGREMPAGNLKQAMLPQGASMINNEIGTACGFIARLNECDFYFTPGVPTEFKHMVNTAILPNLAQDAANQDKTRLQRFYSFGLSESWLNERLSELALPAGATLGYRSAIPFIEVKLFSPANSDTALLTTQIAAVLGEHLVGVDQSMRDAVVAMLSAKGHRLAIYEPFTAGFFSTWLNENPQARAVIKQATIVEPRQGSAKANLAQCLQWTKQAKQQHEASIAIECLPDGEQQAILCLVTDQLAVACKLGFTRRLNRLEQQQYISAFMLNMVRRYLQGLDCIQPAGSMQILEQI